MEKNSTIGIKTTLFIAKEPNVHSTRKAIAKKSDLWQQHQFQSTKLIQNLNTHCTARQHCGTRVGVRVGSNYGDAEVRAGVSKKVLILTPTLTASKEIFKHDVNVMWIMWNYYLSNNSSFGFISGCCCSSSFFSLIFHILFRTCLLFSCSSFMLNINTGAPSVGRATEQSVNRRRDQQLFQWVNVFG